MGRGPVRESAGYYIRFFEERSGGRMTRVEGVAWNEVGLAYIYIRSALLPSPVSATCFRPPRAEMRSGVRVKRGENNI